MHTTARSSRTRASPHFRDCGTAGHRLTGGAVDPHIGAPKEASMTGMTRRELITGAAAAAGAVTLLPGAARAQTTQKRELIVAQGGDIAFFDPHMSTSSNDIRVSFNLYDNLTSRHPDGKLYPGLATEWKLTAPTTWTFKLRPGVRWHNGDPFSSSDVKASIERTYDPAAKTRVSTVFSTIDHIDAPDPATVVFHTKKPDPLLPARLAFYGGQLVPEKYLKSAGLYVLAVNSNVKPLDNPLVKQALSLGIDRQLIVKELWRGRGVVPNSMIAKGDNHFDASLPPLKYDPREARERLKKGGYKGEEV